MDNNEEYQELLENLKEHKFHIAAHELWKARSMINVSAANRSWNNYPVCMDKYPTKLTRKNFL